jgi:uncharacterized membrane protein
MKKYPILSIALISALTAIVVVVVLKIFEFENPTVIAGGVAGGIAGVISTTLIKRSKKE